MAIENAWLFYQKSSRTENQCYFASIYTQSQELPARTAMEELQRAAQEILGYYPVMTKDPSMATFCLRIDQEKELGEEGYELRGEEGRFSILSGGARGLLYGAFACIRMLQREESLRGVRIRKIPSASLRMLNHWDNMNSSIERGYAGNSIFFQYDKVVINEKTRAYARLVASVGINAVVINNVNVKDRATELIEPKYRNSLVRMQEIFSAYGISLYLSLNFAAPLVMGQVNSADPCVEEVRQWWKDKMKEFYADLPGFGGFLVKADSEGRPGPFTYGRTHADGANMLADAVEPYGGRIIWRCFVYNCQQDWRDKKTDRARSGYDHFMPLDGQFRDNVILQIKNGPMDFQVREPVSPLFGGMEHTNQMLEVQITQEYTGQQRHVCYLIPMFKEVLGFHTYCKESEDTVQDLITGKTFEGMNGGIAGVANIGDDDNWTGHDLAAANLFGFGRLSFEMDLSSEEIAKEWIACTYGNDPEVIEKITKILMMSWPVYESYTSPLGIGWMVNPHHHYGPNVDGYEYDRWGTYHRADARGLGVDRSCRGTGYAQQYREPNASMYDSMKTCPEELLLFFHYVPYDYRLKSGKTLIQHIYDTHFEGAEAVEEMDRLWDELKDKIPEDPFERVKERFHHQKWHSKEWRDQINSYFYRKSMIPDEKGRPIY